MQPLVGVRCDRVSRVMHKNMPSAQPRSTREPAAREKTASPGAGLACAPLVRSSSALALTLIVQRFQRSSNDSFATAAVEHAVRVLPCPHGVRMKVRGDHVEAARPL